MVQGPGNGLKRSSPVLPPHLGLQDRSARPTVCSVLRSTGGARLGPAQLARAGRPAEYWLQTLHPSLVRGLPATPDVSWGGWWLVT